MKPRPGHGPRPITWLLPLLALACIAVASGKTVPDATRVLAPGRALAFDVDSNHPETFSIALAQGECVRLRIEQLQNLVLAQAAVSGRALGVTRFRDTGRHGIIRITLVAAAAGTYQIQLSAYEQHQNAAGRIAVPSPPRAATAHDRQTAAAETLLAGAEWARHRGTRSTWPQALADYQATAAAARSLGDRTLLRAALTGESRLSLFRLSAYEAAVTLARAAVAVPDGEQDRPGAALAWKTLGSADYYLANYDESMSADRHALALYRATGDRYWQGIVLGNLAYVYRDVGLSSLALEAARQSLAIARAGGDAFGVDFTLEELGDFHLARGELDQSFADYRRALEALRRQPFPVESAAVWSGLGELFAVAHDDDAAQAAFRKALALAQGAQDSAGALATLADLGDVTLQRGDGRAALRYYQQGIERARSLRLPRDESLLLTGLGGALTAAGQREIALATYRAAIALAARIAADDCEAAAWQGLGDEEARSGALPAARAAYERSLRLWSRESNRVRMATALASLARLDYGQGELPAAQSHIERALELIETSRESLTSRNLRTSYFASQHAYYDLGVAILMALEGRSPGSGDGMRALQLAERARARSLLDGLDRAGRFPAGLVPGSLAQSLRRNREQVDAAYARWRELLQDPTANSTQFDALRRRIESLLRAGDELQALAQARSRRYAHASGAQPASVGQLQRRLLGSDSALLEYWVGEDRSYAWLISRHSVATLVLPGGGVLAQETEALQRAINARAVSVAGESVSARVERVRAADTRAEQLAATIGGQILPACPALAPLHTLYVVADGPLFGVPFAALRARDCANRLVATTAVLREPSASVLSSLIHLGAEHVPSAARPAVAVFADPVYAADDPRLGPVAARFEDRIASAAAIVQWAPEQQALHLPRLSGSGAEAHAIERLSGSGEAAVRTGFAANVQAVRTTDWRRFAVAHFAVHTLLNARYPDFSGLVLTLYHRDGTAEDGVLWLRDIYSLDIPVDLVVLSGCRTLGGQSIPGEGLVGLFRAFLLAGAHAVLGSLWSVEDQPTSGLMAAFYDNLLRRRMPPARALQAAQLAFAHSRRFSALYYWAGFSIEGAGAGAI